MSDELTLSKIELIEGLIFSDPNGWLEVQYNELPKGSADDGLYMEHEGARLDPSYIGKTYSADIFKEEAVKDFKKVLVRLFCDHSIVGLYAPPMRMGLEDGRSMFLFYCFIKEFPMGAHKHRVPELAFDPERASGL